MSKTTAVTDKAENAQGRRRVHPNSLANLKPFPPGVSGNPAGYGGRHPKVTPRLDYYSTFTLKELTALDKTKLPAADLAAVAWWLKACDIEYGDKARVTLTDRLDGPLNEKVGDTNIQVNGGQVVVTAWPGNTST
jgi:hypothetical protein